MAKIPIYQRQRFGPSGAELPSGQMEAVRLAGEQGANIAQAGKTVMGIGSVLGEVAAKQIAAQNAIDTEKAKTDAGVQLEEIFNRHKSETKDPNIFSDSVIKESEAALKSISSGQSKDVSKALEADFYQLAGRTKIRASQEALRKTVDGGLASLSVQEEALRNTALIDFQEGRNLSAGRDAIDKYNTTIQSFVNTGILSQEQGVEKSMKFRDAVAWDGFTQALTIDPTGVAENIDGAIKGYNLTPQQAIRARSMADVSKNTERSKYDGMRGFNIEQLITTGKGVPGFEEKAQGVFGKDYADVKKEIDVARKLFPVAEQIKILPQGEIKKLLDATNPAKKPLSDNPDADIRNYAILEKFAAEEVAARNKDPLASVIDDVAQNPDYQIMIDEAKARQKNMGIVDWKAMGNQERDDFISNFRNASTTERINQVASLKDKYGRHTTKAMSEMISKGLPVEANLMTEVDPKTALWLGETATMKMPELKQMMGDDKNAGNISRETMKQYYEQFGKTIIPSNQGQLGQYAEATAKLSLMYAARGIKNPSESAVNDLYGQYNYSGTLRIPKGYDKGKVGSFASYMMNEGIQKDIGKIDVGGILPDLWLSRLQANGSWYVNEDESGMVLYNEDVPVITKDGNVVEFPFSIAQSFGKKQIGIDIAGYPIEKVSSEVGIK